jgi:hypothetical protein
MSPHERRQFAVNVTWTWPMVLTLLFLAMIPVWGPLLPPLEGALAPVTTKVAFIQQTPVEGGLNVRMSYEKLRDCQILGVSMDKNGVPVEFEPVVGSVDALVTRGTGPQISRLWFVGNDNVTDVRLRWIHRCSPLWTVVTVAYP